MMRGKLNWYVIGAIALGSILNLGPPPANAQGIAEKAEVCAGCHGVDGKPVEDTMTGWRHTVVMAGHWAIHGAGMFAVEEKHSGKCEMELDVATRDGNGRVTPSDGFGQGFQHRRPPGLVPPAEGAAELGQRLAPLPFGAGFCSLAALSR